MKTEKRLSRVVLGGIVEGLLAAGYPCRTRYRTDAIVYFAPVGGYSPVHCREYNVGADTWRVSVRHYSFDAGAGKWLLPAGVEKPRVQTDGHGYPRPGPDCYSLEFSFARSEAAAVAPWIVGYIVAQEQGREPEPFPGLEGRWPWPPARVCGYLWTRQGAAVQDAWQARRDERERARRASLAASGLRRTVGDHATGAA
jgi:hypothetical protein